MKKKVFVTLLAALLVLVMVPVTAFAASPVPSIGVVTVPGGEGLIITAKPVAQADIQAAYDAAPWIGISGYPTAQI